MPNKTTLKRSKPALAAKSPTYNQAVLARRLEILAGCELQHGHHAAAERLTWRAATLREAGR